ncbi:MAG: hypothetical protein ACXWTG_08210 [Methylosarcina sp.]
MIEFPTVFILGAGAHCSYGFPSGEKLKEEIVEAVQNSLKKEAHDRSFLVMPNYGVARVEDVQSNRCKVFAEALANAGQPSIDAFLNANRHQPGFQAIGKGAIAQVLLSYEEKGIQSSNDDWMKYVFQVMLEGVNSPSQLIELNKVGFITFNYDRLLESWLYRSIKYSFGIDDLKAFEVLNQIPIHHIYGKLGPFPVVNEPAPTAWVQASTGIKTIFDAEHDQSVLEASKELLKQAHTVCLLGFGFHRENIKILDLISIFKTKGVFASSRYNILDAEWRRYTKPFEGISIHQTNNYTHMCLGTLRNLPIFQ